MDVKDFYYDLPKELIAQDPLEDRSSSRLLVLDKKTGEMQHKVFKDIVNYLHPGDCLVINDTKVIPARLIGSKEGTDAHIEILLLKRRENDIWETLVKPGKKAKPGTVINFGDGLLKGTVIDVVEEGNRLIQFSYEGIFEEILDQLGQMPLPPYITHQLKDKNRYTSHTVCRIRTAIRRFMRNTKDRRLHRQQVCISRKNCWHRFRKWASRSRTSHFMWVWEPSGRSRFRMYWIIICTRSSIVSRKMPPT